MNGNVMLIGMTRQFSYVVALVCALQFAACRQADGPLPATTPDTSNELGDISRDMQAVAGGDAEGPKDLSDDIGHYAQETNGSAAAAELSRRIAEALKGKNIKAGQAMPVAHTSWVAVAGRQLSEKQVDNLKNDMKTQLMSLGADEQHAQAAADQVGVVQQTVTARHRRWYELL